MEYIGEKANKKPRATGGHCHFKIEMKKACKSASGKPNLKNFLLFLSVYTNTEMAQWPCVGLLLEEHF